MLGLVKQVFIGLSCFNRSLTSVVNIPGHKKGISLNNQQCMAQPILINLHPNEYIQGLCYFPFPVKLDRCMRSCNTLNDLPNKACVRKETEDLNLSVFNMTTGINVSKILTKHISV